MESNFEGTTIVSFSDVEPIENLNIPAATKDGYDLDRLDFSSQYTNPNGMGSNDSYTGTQGADTFEFKLLMNAKPEIIAAKTDRDGKVHWDRIANQNQNYHDHWLEGIGNDTIMDFSGSGGEGDRLNISGHTVAVTILEESDNQVVLGLYSDQSQDGFRANGAHDLDVLGTITVNHDGNFDYATDVHINPMSFAAVGETSYETEINEPSNWMETDNPPMVNEDPISGESGQSSEHTTISIFSDVEPIENPNIPAATKDGYDLDRLDFSSQYTNPNGMGSNDRYTGTSGANTYEFNLLMNAQPEIIAAKTDRDGKVRWDRIANQNQNYHDHWLEGIGNDTIMDFSGSGGEGDRLNISGHTVAVTILEESDNQVVLGLYSDQSQDGFRANGAHDLDVLGTITVNHDGNFDYATDVSLNPMSFAGVVEYA